MEPESIIAQETQTNSKQFDRFSIFLIIKNAQNSYGIKAGDYMRYRRYCGRKVDKLRKAMEYKFGNRTKFNKKDIVSDKIEDKRILQVTLFNCEKYWASANQSKFNDTVKQTHQLRAKFVAIKKFKRAHQWSQKLVKVCQGRIDHITVSQAQAYSYYLEGLLNLEQQQWKACQTKLIGCREIISDLLNSIDTMNAKVYRERIDQIDQTIKFCNFKINKGQQIPIQEIIEMRKNGQQSLSNLISTFAERKLKQMNLNSNEIKFGEQRYPIKDEKIIDMKSTIDVMLQNMEVIKKKVIAEINDQQLFEELLNFYSSVIITIDNTIKMVDTHKQNVKQFTQGEIAIFKKISLLFEEIKFKVLVDRNNMIFKHSYESTDKNNKKSAPQNLAKLLSNTITIFSQLVDLQKQKSQGTDGADPEIIRGLDAKIFYFRTLRLYFVGQVYENNQKTKEAFSLWQQCQRCLESVRSSSEDIRGQLNLVQLNFLTNQLKQNRLKCIIKNYKLNETNKQKLNNEMQELNLEEGQNKEQNDFTLYELMTNKKQSLNLTLNEYSKLEPIELPGKYQPIPTRPIFFDIFETTLQYPNLDNKVQKGGWFSKLFKR